MIMGLKGRQDRTHQILLDSNVARAYEMLIDQESGGGEETLTGH